MNLDQRALIFSYSDSMHYLAGVTHALNGRPEDASLLRDQQGHAIKFPSLISAEEALLSLGFERGWLVMNSPYDEMIGQGMARACEMPIAFTAT